jgi:hypothetical protein
MASTYDAAISSCGARRLPKRSQLRSPSRNPGPDLDPERHPAPVDGHHLVVDPRLHHEPHRPEQSDRMAFPPPAKPACTPGLRPAHRPRLPPHRHLPARQSVLDLPDHRSGSVHPPRPRPPRRGLPRHHDQGCVRQPKASVIAQARSTRGLRSSLWETRLIVPYLAPATAPVADQFWFGSLADQSGTR